MSFLTIHEPLFLVPFLTGLFLSVVLPLLGMYLRLREEWLASLAFAQLAAAGSLAAAISELPVLLGSFSRRVELLAAGAQRVADGDLRTRVGGGGDDALGVVGREGVLLQRGQTAAGVQAHGVLPAVV